MIRTIFVFLTLSISILSKAQIEVDVSLFAGPQLNSARYTIQNVRQSVQLKPGFHAGVGLKVAWDVNLFFFPTFYYSLQGYKVTLKKGAYPPDFLAKNNNTSFHIIALAPLLQFDIGKKSNHFFIKTGPSLEFVVSGTEDYVLGNDSRVKKAMHFGREDYGRYLASLILEFGYEINGSYSIYASYHRELGTMVNTHEGPEVKPRVFGVSFAKTLPYKKKM